MSALTRLRGLLNLSKKHSYHGIPLHLPDHLYRDIGLSKTQVEQLHFELPSRNPYGPRL